MTTESWERPKTVDMMSALFGATSMEGLLPAWEALPEAFRDEAVFAEIRRVLPYDVAIVAETSPLDDALRVTLDRGEGRAIRRQELVGVRRALRGSDLVPMGLRVVVRDAAQLRGMRDRALAPLALERVQPVTAETIRARLDRAFKRPYPALP